MRTSNFTRDLDMQEITNNVIAFFVDLPVVSKILWFILGIVFVVSIIRAILSREGGGIGAGVASGIAAYVFFSDNKWLHDLKYVEPSIRIPLGIVVIIGVLFLLGFILMLSEKLISKKWVRFLGILLRIIGTAGLTVFAILMITSIGNAGMIFY